VKLFVSDCSLTYTSSMSETCSITPYGNLFGRNKGGSKNNSPVLANLVARAFLGMPMGTSLTQGVYESKK
jgi:hypothetical protein